MPPQLTQDKAWKLERSKLRFEPAPQMVQRELITA